MTTDNDSKHVPVLIVLVGPTSSGKTTLAIDIAKKIDGEIIGADSRQIYQYMNIGTAKPTREERASIPHHLIDCVLPDEPLTLAEYQRQAIETAQRIWQQGKTPLLVGGTGLYIKSMVDGFAIPAVSPQPKLRAEWEELAATQGSAALHQLLQDRDPVAANAIPPANIRRVIRALEVCIVTGNPFSEQRLIQELPYRTLQLGLNTERSVLYEWADRRADQMIVQGLIAEVEELVSRGYDWKLPSMSSLGYRQIGAYLRGEMSLPDALQRLKFDTHGFIRKQVIWFRPDHRIHWLDATDQTNIDQSIALISEVMTV